MIRRQLLRQLPAFSHFYGLHPWDIERLTFREVDEYIYQLSEYQKDLEDAAKR